jgi:polyketide cyclase/dehydrase/lipid transport protein
MAVRHQLVERTPRQVWSVLADRSRYSDWVVGVADSVPGRGDWPEMGSDLTYKVVVGRWTGTGRTVVRRSEPPYLLELEADSGPLGTARIAIEVRPWGEADSIVVLDEHPLRGPGGSVHNAAIDVFQQLRNRGTLSRLRDTIEQSTPRESRVPVS